MKKFYLLVINFCLIWCLIACINPKINPETSADTLTIFSLNDTHGVVYAKDDSLSRFGKYYKEYNENHKMLITNGDMLQGTAFSNVYFGAPIIKTLNNIGIDAFNIGNHEFDWGIDKITRLRDGKIAKDHEELSCPIIAANIFKKADHSPLENTVPYIVKEYNGVKVGVIGLIGKIENSIEYSRIKNYYFGNPLEYARKYARELRETEGCSGVIITIHSGGESELNHQLASLYGPEKIDAVFNGHTHKTEWNLVDGKMPAIQSNPGSKTFFCSLSFKLNKSNITFINGSQKHYDITNMQPDTECEMIRNDYLNRPEYAIFKNTLTISNSEISKYLILNLVVRHINKVYNSDIAFFNNGGIRTYGFNQGAITGVDVYSAMPFDNKVITCEVPGYIIRSFAEKSLGLISYPSNLDFINNSTIYKVSGIDYVLNSNRKENKIKQYHEENPFSLWQVHDVIYRNQFIDLLKNNNPFDYDTVLQSLY